jgi:hypothetical protein
MNNKIDKLDQYIKILKENFPNYKYENAMLVDSSEKKLLRDEYTVFVMEIPESEIEAFTNYYFNEIYLKCAERNEELPSIVTLQNRTNTAPTAQYSKTMVNHPFSFIIPVLNIGLTSLDDSIATSMNLAKGFEEKVSSQHVEVSDLSYPMAA